MASPSDKVTNLMARAPSDHLAAWMIEYGPALRRYFARRVGTVHADDLVQEVFLRLQVTSGEAATENIERHLFTVAKRVLLNRYRTDTRRQAGSHDTIDEAKDLPDELSPERILAAKQEYAIVLVAILALPPRMRTAFVLHRFAKLSLSTIAKRMGIKKASVQTLVERAIERVAEGLEDEA